MTKTPFCSPGSWRAPCATPRLPRRGPERWWAEGWSANKLRILKVNSCKLHLFFFKTLGNFPKNKFENCQHPGGFFQASPGVDQQGHQSHLPGNDRQAGYFPHHPGAELPDEFWLLYSWSTFSLFQAIEYGTNMVGGVNSKKGGTTHMSQKLIFFSGDSSSFWRCQVWPFRVLEMWISGEQKSNLFTQLWRSCFFFESQCSSSTLLCRNWDLPIFANCMEAKKETRWGVAKRSPLKWVTSQLGDFCSLFLVEKKHPSDFWLGPMGLSLAWMLVGGWFYDFPSKETVWQNLNPASHWGIGR